MARYVARVQTPMPVPDAFALVCDMRTFETWDPGIAKVVQVVGEGPGPGATYEVTTAGFPRGVTLRYVTTALDVPADPSDPHEVLLEARSAALSSFDRITVTAAPGGSVVVYDADLRLAGPLRLGDVGLALAFRWIGARAEAGLREATSGVSVAA